MKKAAEERATAQAQSRQPAESAGDGPSLTRRQPGSAIAGGSDVAIVVNGDNVAVGESRTFEARLDPVTNVYKYIAAPTVTNACSAGIWFEIDSYVQTVLKRL